MIKVLLIAPNHFPSIIDIDERDLSAWQNIVEGYIEAVTFPDVTFYLNEDGAMLPNLQTNDYATRLFASRGIRMSGGIVVGHVLVAGPADAHGYSTSVPDQFVQDLARGKE